MEHSAQRAADHDSARQATRPAHAPEEAAFIEQPEPQQAVAPLRAGGHVTRSSVMNMQRSLGNQFVQRQLHGRRGATSRRIIARAPADSGEAAGPTSIGDGSATVTAEGGAVKISGGTIQLESSMVQTDGALRAGTLIADSVVAASYTPGAGNLQ